MVNLPYTSTLTCRCHGRRPTFVICDPRCLVRLSLSFSVTRSLSDLCSAYSHSESLLLYCSSYSIQYTGGSVSRAACPNIREKVLGYHSKLVEWQTMMKEGTMPALPLLATRLEDTLAILICKVLVPLNIKATCMRVTGGSCETNYCTPLPASVCPHLLVHIHRSFIL